jgi:hypothetical protein
MRWHLWSFSFCKTTKILLSYVTALSSVCRQNGLSVITWVVDDGFFWILNSSTPVKPLNQINHVCWDYTWVVGPLSILCNSCLTFQIVIISNSYIHVFVITKIAKMFLYYFKIWAVNLWYSIVWDLIYGFIKKKLLKGCHKKE